MTDPEGHDAQQNMKWDRNFTTLQASELCQISCSAEHVKCKAKIGKHLQRLHHLFQCLVSLVLYPEKIHDLAEFCLWVNHMEALL